MIGASWTALAYATELSLATLSANAVHKRYARLGAEGARTSRLVVTAEARRIVPLAREEAQRLGRSAVGVEHLLLALLAAGRAPLGVSLESARSSAQGLPMQRAGAGGITAGAHRALEQSLQECVADGVGELRPEHVLRAVLRHRRAVALLG